MATLGLRQPRQATRSHPRRRHCDTMVTPRTHAGEGCRGEAGRARGHVTQARRDGQLVNNTGRQGSRGPRGSGGPWAASPENTRN